MSEDSIKKWAAFWSLLAVALTLVWIHKVNFLTGIGYGLIFSFLKRFVIKSTIAKYLTFTPQNSDLNKATLKLSSKLNRNILGCTLLQFLALLIAISVNEKKIAGEYSRHPRKAFPGSVSKSVYSPSEGAFNQPVESPVSTRPSTEQSPPLPSLGSRVWTDSQGRQLTAELIDVRANQAGIWWGKFRRPDGESFTYQMDKLSTSDINFLKTWLASRESLPAIGR